MKRHRGSWDGHTALSIAQSTETKQTRSTVKTSIGSKAEGTTKRPCAQVCFHDSIIPTVQCMFIQLLYMWKVSLA